LNGNLNPWIVAVQSTKAMCMLLRGRASAKNSRHWSDECTAPSSHWSSLTLRQPHCAASPPPIQYNPIFISPHSSDGVNAGCVHLCRVAMFTIVIRL